MKEWGWGDGSVEESTYCAGMKIWLRIPCIYVKDKKLKCPFVPVILVFGGSGTETIVLELTGGQTSQKHELQNPRETLP